MMKKVTAMMAGGLFNIRLSGSGLIASESGLILTNQHVVERAEKVEVSIPGRKKRYPAKVLGTDKQTDIAVLKIEHTKPLPFVSFSDSDAARVGDWVIALGDPYGLGASISMGIVSSKARDLWIDGRSYPDLIQTDAAINPIRNTVVKPSPQAGFCAPARASS